jgi:hypothetical protein
VLSCVALLLELDPPCVPDPDAQLLPPPPHRPRRLSSSRLLPRFPAMYPAAAPPASPDQNPGPQPPAFAFAVVDDLLVPGYGGGGSSHASPPPPPPGPHPPPPQPPGPPPPGGGGGGRLLPAGLAPPPPPSTQALYTIHPATPTNNIANKYPPQSVPSPVLVVPAVPARSGYRLSPSSLSTSRYSTPQLPRSTYGSSGESYPSQITSVEPRRSVVGRDAAVHDQVMSSAE